MVMEIDSKAKVNSIPIIDGLGECAVQPCAAQRAAQPPARPCRHRSDDRKRSPRRARRVLYVHKKSA
ncbi:hypothetical protein RHMOL_Rhmol01G0123200 [Rhododendron molle]|uniref:Uncharacterized protein n=1 Tax=Rhododendron molle TaxID=49168 RepID=A0ACC0Q0Y4_RHOML|nr:hypothetical protein RHMOL_Rhmol01G0123200 [Rhododendron molle]